MRSAFAYVLAAALVALPLFAHHAHADQPLVISIPGDYPTIQQGLNAAAFGDLVVVEPGTYVENIVMSAQHDGVRLVSAAGPEVTFIDGGQTARVFTIDDVGPQTRIEGFTIQNGRAEPFTPENLGGAMHIDDSDVRIEGNIIRDCLAEAAGGLYVDYCAPTIIHNLFMNNEALGSGGAVYIDHYSPARVEHNVFFENICGHHGGGITIWVGSTPSVINNTFVANEAVKGGGGVFINMNAHPELFRNIIAGNGVGGGIRVHDSQSTTSFACNDVWNNAPYDYSGMPDLTGVDGNISDDPMFCDVAALDFTLHSTSPCAPGNSPSGCNLIGALDVGCGPMPVQSSTWGRIKSSYLIEE
jgi:hypothetical protein